MDKYKKISKAVTEHFREDCSGIKKICVSVQDPEVYHGITFYFSPKVNVYTYGLSFVNQFELIDVLWKYCGVRVSLNDISVIPTVQYC